MLVERKIAFNQHAGGLGRWCPQKAMQVFKGEVISVDDRDGGRATTIPHKECLSGPPWDLSWGAVLFTECVHKIIQGEARKEVWSSVTHFYIFDLQREPHEARYCVMQRCEKCARA